MPQLRDEVRIGELGLVCLPGEGLHLRQLRPLGDREPGPFGFRRLPQQVVHRRRHGGRQERPAVGAAPGDRRGQPDIGRSGRASSGGADDREKIR